MQPTNVLDRPLHIEAACLSVSSSLALAAKANADQDPNTVFYTIFPVDGPVLATALGVLIGVFVGLQAMHYIFRRRLNQLVRV